MYLDLSIGLRLDRVASGGAPPPPTYAPETTALLARMTVQPSTARAGVIDNVITSLKSAGVWTKLDCLYLMAAHDRQAARLNWIANSFTLNEAVAPSWTVDRGYTGDGSTQYIDTGFNPTTAPSPKFVQNSAAMGIWCGTNVLNASQYDIGNQNSLIGALASASTAKIRPNQTTLMNGTIPGNTSVGLTAWSRFDASNYSQYKNGAMQVQTTNASAALTNGNFYIGAFDNAGLTSPSTRREQAAFWGSALADADQTAIYNALAAYMTAVGA